MPLLPLSMLILLLILSLLFPVSLAESRCPNPCNQLACLTGVLSCPDPGLAAIPGANSIPRNTNKLLISHQTFSQPFLGPANFSGLAPPTLHIVKLTLQYSAIRSIQPRTFSPLRNLSFLDLSYNRITLLQPDTFHGLSLLFLRLDGNLPLTLLSTSLRGLAVATLSLVKCGLTSVPPGLLMAAVLGSQRRPLRRLLLTQNRLSSLDPALSPALAQLTALQLGDNPWRCGLCAGLSPLHRLAPALCTSEHECQPGLVRALELSVLTARSAALLCQAADPAMTVRLHQLPQQEAIAGPSQGSSKANVPLTNSVTSIQCSVSGPGGTANLTVAVQTGPFFSAASPATSYTTSASPSPPPDTAVNPRRFTLLELIAGVAASFTLSLLLFLPLYRRRLLSAPHPRTGRAPSPDHSSCSQLYDVPNPSATLHSPAHIFFPPSPPHHPQLRITPAAYSSFHP